MTSLVKSHIPVLLPEVLSMIRPKKGGRYIDATFGFGGYSRGILDTADCGVLAIDRDPSVRESASALTREYGSRFVFEAGRFSGLKSIAERHPDFLPVDGIVMDIGVSSMQIDQADRGFSFQKDGPLDMRMEQAGASAADVVNGEKEEKLADILYYYGEETNARKIARKIVQSREEEGPIETTFRLAGVVRKALPFMKNAKTDPATRTFQAFRIYVNRELDELKEGLNAAASLLGAEGRLSVVTFHSLEDRIVKEFFNAKIGKREGVSRHVPVAVSESSVKAGFSLLTKKPIMAGEEETSANPRSRSAKLRGIERAS